MTLVLSHFANSWNSSYIPFYINNNHAPFYLWQVVFFVKYQKASNVMTHHDINVLTYSLPKNDSSSIARFNQ